MGMSTWVEGFIEPDADYKKKFKAYKACEDAGIAVPDELQEFFGWDTPHAEGRTVNLQDAGCARKGGEDSRDEWVVDLKALPEGVTKIRFVNSY